MNPSRLGRVARDVTVSCAINPGMPQPHRGDRVLTSVRLPRQYREAAEQIAARDGIAVGDAVTKVFGEALGFPVPHYCLPKSTADQGELPLTKAS